MFFFVARLRLQFAIAIFLFSFVHAHQDVLYTSSVSYCAPPEDILVEVFEITYFRANDSISFNVSAASVVHNNVTANVLLNVYGMQPINFTLDLCSIADGLLCPLPTYDFVGADSIPLPPSVDVSSELPGIAYVIPDLESYAQLTLLDVETGEMRACIQSTLSNGWTTHQYAVEWTTGAIVLLALAAAIWQTLACDSLALTPIRLLDIFYLYQTIATSGLLSLNYPIVYRAFTLNFAWSIGLFAASTTSHFQNSINNMRHLTGGDLADASSSGATSLVNRKLSPYNQAPGSNLDLAIPQSLMDRFASLPQVDLSKLFSRDAVTDVAETPKVLASGAVATVTQESANVLQAGIPIYVNTIGIATANAFMTVFLVSLILAAIMLAGLALAYGLLWWAGRYEWARRRMEITTDLRASFPDFARAWGLRAALITLFPVLTFAFAQWTLKDSWLSVLLSVILVIILMALIIPSVLAVLSPYTLKALSRFNVSFSESALIPLSAPFQPHRLWYLIPLLIAIFFKSLVIAFAHAHGLAQTICFLCADVVVFGLLVLVKPYRTRHADILMGYLGLLRIIADGLMIAFAESLNLSAIPRVVIGIIIAVLWSIAVVIMFLNILVNIGLWKLIQHIIPWCGWGRRRQGDKSLASNPSHNDSSSMLEKGEKGEKESPSEATQHTWARPGNPSPPTSASFPNSEHPSTYSASSLGQPLPSRWSFQHSRPPSGYDESSPTSPSAAPHSVSPSPSTPTLNMPTHRHTRQLSSVASPTIEEHDTPNEA